MFKCIAARGNDSIVIHLIFIIFYNWYFHSIILQFYKFIMFKIRNRILLYISLVFQNFIIVSKRGYFCCPFQLFITDTTVSNVLFLHNFCTKCISQFIFSFILLFSIKRHIKVDFLMQILDMHIIFLFDFKAPSVKVEYRY